VVQWYIAASIGVGLIAIILIVSFFYSDADTQYNKGVELLDAGKYEEAITYFDKALAIEPNDVDALNNKGIALHNLGKNQEAIALFDKVLLIKPNDVMY
jgi:tetratricopeptide (TPR) repeat protein